MKLLVDFLHGAVKRLWNVVGLCPVDLASSVLATGEAKQVKAVGNDPTTEGRGGGEIERC